MNHALLSNEPVIRLGFFVGIFALMAVWELVAPRRPLAVGRLIRWPNNLGITALNTAFVRIAFPTAAVALALLGEERAWGLLNNVKLPQWLEIAIAVLVLDFAIYLQHVLFHAVPGLWRLHRMHHADLDFDVTTGARFHPVEILLSMVIKFAAVAALGAPAAAVLLFEVLLNATSMFNHGNVRLPARCRPHFAMDRRYARHAPRPSLGRAARNQQQFRLQCPLVGQALRHLSGAA